MQPAPDRLQVHPFLSGVTLQALLRPHRLICSVGTAVFRHSPPGAVPFSTLPPLYPAWRAHTYSPARLPAFAQTATYGCTAYGPTLPRRLACVFLPTDPIARTANYTQPELRY